MPVTTLILFLPPRLCAFLAFSLPLLSHISFSSNLVVGPHRTLLSPGPLVTNNSQVVPPPDMVNAAALRCKKIYSGSLLSPRPGPL